MDQTAVADKKRMLDEAGVTKNEAVMDMTAVKYNELRKDKIV